MKLSICPGLRYTALGYFCPKFLVYPDSFALSYPGVCDPFQLYVTVRMLVILLFNPSLESSIKMSVKTKNLIFVML